MNLDDRLKRFGSQQDNLDAVYWLMKGYSYRNAGEKIGRSHAFVQRVHNFLRNQGLTTGRQWRVDVSAMDMTKTFKFYDYDISGRPDEVRENNAFLTYFADIKRGKSGHFAMYTFPNEIYSRIGESISPFYILVPMFKAPLHETEISPEEFIKVLEKEDNVNPLPPRGKSIDPDIIHIGIAQYVELFSNPSQDESTKKAAKKIEREGLGEVNLSKLVEMIEDDIKNEELADVVDVTYDIVRNRYKEMVKKKIIYPGFGIDMRKFDYFVSFCWIESHEIYRIIKTFSHFNVVTALAYTQGNRYLLNLQYPKNKEIEIFKILNNLDLKNEVFKVLAVHNNRTIPHPFYYEKLRKNKIQVNS